MNTIEDRLRAATQAAADTVTDFSQPPLRLPARARSFGQRRPRIEAPRLMASVAAATAIVAVAGTIIVARDVTAGGPPAAGRATAAIKAAVPPFFAAAIERKSSPAFFAGAVAVGRTATGRILATVRPPAPYTAFGPISAAPDDRTFVLTALKPPVVYPPNTIPGPGPSRLYLLHLHPGRTPAVTLTVLPKIGVFGSTVRVVEVSLSPSGGHLAVELQPANRSTPASLRVYDLADGRFLTWSVPSPDQPILLPGSSALSWVDGNRFLAILLYSDRPRNCRNGCVRLLDTTRSGGSILAASKTTYSTAAIHRFANWYSVLVTPDGSRMILTGDAGRREGNGTSFDKPLAYNIALPSGHILSRLTGRDGTGFGPLWVGARSGPVIYGQRRIRVGLTATIYASRRRIPLHLPTETLEAAW